VELPDSSKANMTMLFLRACLPWIFRFARTMASVGIEESRKYAEGGIEDEE
jgi:hypothetical protein